MGRGPTDPEIDATWFSRDLPRTMSARAAKMRVIHVVLSMDCGGLERVVLNLTANAIKYSSSDF